MADSYDNMMGTEMDVKDHPDRMGHPDLVFNRTTSDIVREGNNPSSSSRFNSIQPGEDGSSDLLPSRVDRVLQRQKKSDNSMRY